MKFNQDSLTRFEMRWTLSEADRNRSAMYETLAPTVAVPMLKELARNFKSKFVFEIAYPGVRITRIRPKR